MEFLDKIRVVGVTYSYDTYKSLSVADRDEMRRSAYERLVKFYKQEPLPATAGDTKPETVRYPSDVNNVFRKWSERAESSMEKLSRLLAGFDWYYDYSDDHRVWSAGHRRRDEIRRLVKHLGDEGEAVYNKAYSDFFGKEPA